MSNEVLQKPKWEGKGWEADKLAGKRSLTVEQRNPRSETSASNSGNCNQASSDGASAGEKAPD